MNWQPIIVAIIQAAEADPKLKGWGDIFIPRSESDYFA